MADFKNRVRKEFQKHKMTWIMVMSGGVVIILFLVLDLFLNKEESIKWSLLFLFLYVISVAVWQIYSGVRYKEIIIPGTYGGGGSATKEKKPIWYFVSLSVYIATVIGFIYLLILLLRNFASY